MRVVIDVLGGIAAVVGLGRLVAYRVVAGFLDAAVGPGDLHRQVLRVEFPLGLVICGVGLADGIAGRVEDVGRDAAVGVGTDSPLGTKHPIGRPRAKQTARNNTLRAVSPISTILEFRIV
jgi:hypothetical protein